MNIGNTIPLKVWKHYTIEGMETLYHWRYGNTIPL